MAKNQKYTKYSEIVVLYYIPVITFSLFFFSATLMLEKPNNNVAEQFV